MIGTVNRRAALFLLLYVTAILYLSLYPWRFIPHPGLWTLFWIPPITRRTLLDAFLNVVFYMPLGAAAFASLRRGAVAFFVALAFGTLVSFAVELTQLSIPGRFGNLTDLVCNSAGTLLGIAVFILATRPPVASRWRALYSPGVLLVGLWAVWQVFLFLPRYGPAIEASHLIAGLVVLSVGVSRRQVPYAVPLLLMWLAFEELRPFRFQGPPQPFWWLPFESWFEGAPDSYYATFFGKLFLYTAVVAVERRSRIGWGLSLAAPAAILAAGEFAQRYLPGRTPEITDLVLLAAGAVLLNLAEPHRDNVVSR